MNGRNQRTQAGVCKLVVRAQFDLAIRVVVEMSWREAMLVAGANYASNVPTENPLVRILPEWSALKLQHYPFLPEERAQWSW
jgi:hypothetical protein